MTCPQSTGSPTQVLLNNLQQDVLEEKKEVLCVGDESDDTSCRGLKVLFLSSDTGGGHRASAESLAKQFQLLYPGTTYDLIDVVASDGVPPYNSLVSWYKHLGAHPAQWKIVYGVSNSRAFEVVADAHLKLMCERAVRRRIKSYDPDVVVSVHPLMNNVPVLSCAKISHETGKHLPMFTVVTDLGSAHCLWFNNGVEKLFVGSNQVEELAKTRGKVSADKLVRLGLPIRHDFSVQSDKMGDRMSPEGKAYQRKVREELELPHVDRKTILIMGGGEGVGSLSNIVNAVYFELVSQGIDAVVLVVCGRNEKLKQSLDERDWDSVLLRWKNARERHGISKTYNYCGTTLPETGCIEANTLTRILSNGSFSPSFNRTQIDAVSVPPQEMDNTIQSPGHIEDEDEDEFGKKPAEVDEQQVVDNIPMVSSCDICDVPSISFDASISSNDFKSQCNTPGKVEVVGLGFVTKMAEYMVAADVLVSKAGPGTISEAAALSLPVLLTSFLPGQEEGNVDFVVDGGFGVFCSDTDPIGIAEELCMWLTDNEKMKKLSQCAKTSGTPNAARDIAKQIGDSALKWRSINDEISTKGRGEGDSVSDDSSEEGSQELSRQNVDTTSAQFGGNSASISVAGRVIRLPLL